MASKTESRLLKAIRRIDEVTSERQRSGVGHDEADDIVGTIDCDDAIGFDPLPLLRAFDNRGNRVVIVGQVAGILHGSSELTGDLDFIWSGESDDALAMRDAFGDVDASLYDDDGTLLPRSVAAFDRPKVLFRSAGASGDCCTPDLPWGDLDVHGLMMRADSTVVEGVRLHYASLADLTAMRLAAGRPKDLRRAAELTDLHRGAPP